MHGAWFQVSSCDKYNYTLCYDFKTLIRLDGYLYNETIFSQSQSNASIKIETTMIDASAFPFHR